MSAMRLITPSRMAEFRAEHAKSTQRGYVVSKARGFCRSCLEWFPGETPLVTTLRGRPCQLCVRCKGVW